MKIENKEAKKLMAKFNFILIKLTKHTFVFSNGVHRVGFAKTTSDKHRAFKNLKAEMRRLGYE